MKNVKLLIMALIVLLGNAHADICTIDEKDQTVWCSSDKNRKIIPDKRVALVIGNAEYAGDFISDLKAPTHDARLITERLAHPALGFTVTTKENVNHDEMNKALAKFKADAKQASIALLYFSGHSSIKNKTNYIIYNGSHENQPLEEQGMPIAEVKKVLIGTRAKNQILLLDVGTTSNVVVPDGMFIGFSSFPGSWSLEYPDNRGSIFTYALTNNLLPEKAKNKTWSQVMQAVRLEVLKLTNDKQRPFYIDNTDEDIQIITDKKQKPAPETGDKEKAAAEATEQQSKQITDE